MSPNAINSLSAAIQPLVFETGIEGAPYSTAGTAFLVGCQRRAFVITARHLLRPDALTPLCIFPSDLSRRMIPLLDIFYLPAQHVTDDFADFAVIEIDRARLDAETQEATIIDLALAEQEWISECEHSDFTVIGYPIEQAFVDYEREVISTTRRVLKGKYACATHEKYLHEINLEGDLGLSTFSGFSGSPVFSWHEYEPGKARIALCGMAVQGTPQSRCLRFIEWRVIRQAIELRMSRPTTK